MSSKKSPSRVHQQDNENIQKLYQQIAESESTLVHLKKQHKRILAVNKEEKKQIEEGKALLAKYEHQNKELDQFIEAIKASSLILDGHLNQAVDILKTVNMKRDQFKINMTRIVESLLSKIYL